MKKIINYSVKPESKIQNEIIEYLELRKWYVRILHGNAHQSGMPDLFICRRSMGWRFVEVKQPKAYIFTENQAIDFPKFQKEGVGIWVLTAATDHEYMKLSAPANWWHYFEPTKIRSPKDKKKPPDEVGPEAIIQRAIVARLELEGWFVKRVHCDVFQVGLPDLLACKRGEGFRWIEVKNPTRYKFTGAQYECFPRLMSEGVGVWILIGDSDSEINKLKGPPNWTDYLKGASL